MTATPVVPADVLTNVRQRWPQVADAWANNVENEFRALCDKHQAIPRTVLPARYGFVVAADAPDGPLVMRSSPDPHGPRQAAVAVALAKLGLSPAVHHTSTNAHGTWTILDRVHPGTPLGQTDPATVKLEALITPLAAMNGQPAPLAGMPPITDWLRARLEDDRLADLRPGTTVAPIEERRAALCLLTELTRDHTPGLCHGDSSLSNILSCAPDGWKLVDPRGMAGESAYDVAVLAIRVVQFYGSTNIVPYITEVADVDFERVKAWMEIAGAARV